MGYGKMNYGKPKKKKPKDQTKKKKPKDQAKKKPQSSEIDPNLIAIGSGTGFYINNKGYALTNNHVVEICKQVTTIVEGKEILFNVVGTDQILDIATKGLINIYDLAIKFRVKEIFLASSSEVYHTPKKIPTLKGGVLNEIV